MRQAVVLCGAAVAAAAGASDYDLRRARQIVPRGHYKGHDFLSMAGQLNRHLVMSGARTKACKDHARADLDSAVRGLIGSFDGRLQEIYAAAGDLRSLRHGSLAAYEQQWEADEGAAREAPELADLLRDGKCHEVVMMWVHHVPAAAKKALRAAGFTVPLLPYVDHRGRFADAAPGSAHAQAMGNYTSLSGCNSCHSTGGTAGSGYPTLQNPRWPSELTYEGTGYCYFPWWGGHQYMSGDDCAKNGVTADITVYYQYDNNLQQINHSTCDLSKWGGSKSSGCNSVWSGAEGWIYTYSKSGQSDFCCTINQPPTPTVRPDFMTLFPSPTQTAHADGPFYNGTINFYQQQTPDGVDFWYNQEPAKGTPIGQGEAGPLGWVSVEYSSFMGKPTADGLKVRATMEDPWFQRVRSHADAVRDLPSSCNSATQCNN